MKKVELIVNGMSCGHCVMSLKKELSKIDGANVVDVKVGSAKVEYDEEKVSGSALAAAVDEAGFSLVEEKTV